MNDYISRIRRPVKRENAEQHVLLALLSFAASVALTRLFLQLADYPQIGNSELHIAHVLWGGLLLFVAALSPLIFANRWVYPLSALLGGAGVGLFIDEVGKFITQNNNYFYPAAAPIIYVLFLLTVLVYLQVRRPSSRDARAELYCALDVLAEVLDNDLDTQERTELQARLRPVAQQTAQPDQARLANVLLDFLASPDLHVVPHVPGFGERCLKQVQAFETRWVKRRRLKAALTGALGALGLLAVAKLVSLTIAAFSPTFLEQMVNERVALDQVRSASGMGWFSARLALEGSVGLLLLVAAVLLIVGRERRGVQFGFFGLLLSLTAVNLLVFYFDQFSTIFTAMVQFGLLLGVLYYRRRYLTDSRRKLASTVSDR
jgi:hypothetical protein